MKKIYEAPEIEVLTLRLSLDVLAPSIESGQHSGAGGSIDDDNEDDLDLL